MHIEIELWEKRALIRLGNLRAAILNEKAEAAAKKPDAGPHQG